MQRNVAKFNPCRGGWKVAREYAILSEIGCQMTAKIQINGIQYDIDLSDPIDISIPLVFDGPQPNAYGARPATSKPCEAGEIVGDTRRGGSVNFEQHTFIPHCNGTHTECVGHITNERISVSDCLQDVLVPAALMSVERSTAIFSLPGKAISPGDFVITKETLVSAIKPINLSLLDTALIVRTLPNNKSKKTRQYGEAKIPPYFTSEAMKYIVECGFKHLLVDLPSIDRLFDEGKLSNHRIFWNVEPGSFETHAATRISNTITELIYVPNEVEDGEYLLNLQIAPFTADASPSRPILFKIF